MGSLSGSGLISSAVAGLNNSFGILNANGSGLKLSNLTNLTTTQVNQLGLNSASFVSYMQSSFGNIDKNADGTISSKELQQLTTQIQTQGLTKDQITTLCSNMSGTNSYSTVLEYFDQIDTNHDGKVTDAEIKAFQYKAQRQKLDTQMNSVKSSNITLFYGEENEATPSSILDDFYPDI